MNKQLSKKLFAFIIGSMMFFAIPGSANAQKPEAANAEKKCKGCPRGSFCWRGKCVSWYPVWSVFATADETLSASASQITTINFQIEQPEFVSIKLSDINGRLIKTLANSRMREGEYQIEWGRKDALGNTVSAGTYILQLNAGSKTETRKLSVTAR